MQGPPLEEEKDGGRRCVPEWKNNGCYSLDIAGKRQLPVRNLHNSKNEDDDGCTRSSLYKAELLKARGLTSRLKTTGKERNCSLSEHWWIVGEQKRERKEG